MISGLIAAEVFKNERNYTTIIIRVSLASLAFGIFLSTLLKAFEKNYRICMLVLIIIGFTVKIIIEIVNEADNSMSTALTTILTFIMS